MPTGIGQKAIITFNLVDSGSTTPFPECDDNKFDCNFIVPVFANASGSELENDKSSILAMFEAWTTASVFVIQKKVGGVWTDQATITDQTYGEYYALGTLDFTSYAGIVLYWSVILDSFGEGEYRIKLTETNPMGNVETFSRTYCLKTFGCGGKNNTVRLEWYLNSGIGDIDNDKKVLDFSGLNWYSQIRLPNSIFGYPISSYEDEQIQYGNGEIQNVKDIQEEKYTLTIGAVPAWVHNIIKTYALQSDKLLITDYSANNPQEIIQKEVKRTSAYEPRWIKTSKCSPVTVEFKPSFNRLERFRCL